VPALARLLIASLTAGLLYAPAALAIGLGPAKGEPVIGEPLAVEIGLIEAENIAPECFQISPSPSGTDDQYFPPQARVALSGANDKVSVTVRAGEVKQPVVEFRLTLGCGAKVSRDYVFLAAPSRALRHEPARTATPSTPSTPLAPPPVASQAKQTRAPLSLDALAQERYPQQPKAREKFKKMLRAANPAIFANTSDDQAFAAAVETLRFPDNLPQRRYGPYVPPGKAPPPKPPEVKPAAPPEAAPSVSVAPAKPTQDRLSIAAGPGGDADAAPASPAEIAVTEKAQASFAAQDELTARLSQAEATYVQLKHLVLRMEARMDELEAERDRLKRENAQQAENATMKLVLAILFGGVLGALAISAYQYRRKIQPSALQAHAPHPPEPQTPAPQPTPRKIDLDDILVPHDASESTWQDRR